MKLVSIFPVLKTMKSALLAFHIIWNKYYFMIIKITKFLISFSKSSLIQHRLYRGSNLGEQSTVNIMKKLSGKGGISGKTHGGANY